MIKGTMTIDERLERLTERDEALAQSLELMRINSEETGQQIRNLLLLSGKHDRQIEALLSLATKHDALWNEIALSTARLVHTAELHPQQLDAHDERLDNLEGT